MPVSRTRRLQEGDTGQGPVIYWMHRNHRARDNEALLCAQAEALRLSRPLVVAYGLAESFLGATVRHFGFLLRGLEETAVVLREAHIPFILRRGEPGREVGRLARDLDAALVVTDFDPLRIKKTWRDDLLDTAACPVLEADARNVVPCWAASDKREYAAYTIRPKIHRLLDDCLTEPEDLEAHPHAYEGEVADVDWAGLLDDLPLVREVAEVDTPPGEAAAHQALAAFCAQGLQRYARRNDPLAEAVSGLSPYLHFGQLSARRACLAVRRAAEKAGGLGDEAASFLEECIVRRELADNFCEHAPDYDTVSCFPDWARETLDAHRKDARPSLYAPEDFEAARTHDLLWNAAQRQMMTTGTMHGYLRMYWAKKILEWSESPEQAMATAIRLNDRYELDGRDPNGYAGVAWSLGGVHDRAFKERKVYGKIRYMNEAGCRRKFDVDAYVEIYGG